MVSKHVLTRISDRPCLVTEKGDVYYLHSNEQSLELTPEFSEWLKQAESFRYESRNLANKPITIRSENRKDQLYWYAYLRLNGKLHKEYVGQLNQLTECKLEEVSQYLNHPGSRPKPEQKLHKKIVQQTDLLPVLTEAIAKLETIAETPRNNFSKEKKALLQSVIASLAELAEAGQSV